jgi:hypothetical protein
VEVLASFFTLLYSIRVRSEGDDKLWWTPSHKGKFDVSSFYKVLAAKRKLLSLREVFGGPRFP